MRHKSLAIICDASPKAKHDEPKQQMGCFFLLLLARIESWGAYQNLPEVWLPVFGLPNHLSVGTLQRLSTLLPSSATAPQKLGAANLVAESHTKTVLAEPATKQERKKLPLAALTNNSNQVFLLVGCS